MVDLIERLRKQPKRSISQKAFELSIEAADELSALRERVEALEGAARAVCDGQASRASVNNLRAMLATPKEAGREG